MKLLKYLILPFLLSVCLPSQAALIELDSNGSTEPMSATNDYFYGLLPDYNIGGNLYTTETVRLTFTYLGHEAAYNNDFTAYGQTLNNKTNNVGDSFKVVEVGPGLIDFSFYSNTIDLGIANGSNNDFGSLQSFATILDYTFRGIEYDAIILFDDSGYGPDDNHDDHLIGIQASVPEPSIMALLGVGLIGLGMARRKRI